MSVPDIYSRRNNIDKHNDIYNYDTVPKTLKIQVMYIAEDLFGNGSSVRPRGREISSNTIWTNFGRLLFREWALPFKQISPKREIEHALNSPNLTTPQFLDFCELIFILAEKIIRVGSWRPSTTISSAIEELNTRFLEAGFGYQYDGGKIIRIDNQLIHKEIIIPTLQFLSDPLFKKSDEDYRLAHDHYRKQHVKDCVIACGRSFESMMKAICDNKGWAYQSGARASDLIKILREKGLFPAGANRSFDTYISMLKTGVPDLRNENGGHGAAPDTPEPALHMAAYALHLTASNLLFLANSWKALENID
ncbi:hypothetical protein GS501_00290 [Saccharibacter sp. 17.LH.SD]|uniref:STM4504/CBY_0614 family protein n=1 Tax=Saccharibacter sp. 17.LH.SD TaxID=2689393 RepID=UPI00136C3E9F|nr:hypothetical protein [Saccharibacter sp. 17.LH.SD]MXV43519.1 hypothetical protein [Saccharibacter sp. 17.LH.SD]